MWLFSGNLIYGSTLATRKSLELWTARSKNLIHHKSAHCIIIKTPNVFKASSWTVKTFVSRFNECCKNAKRWFSYLEWDIAPETRNSTSSKKVYFSIFEALEFLSPSQTPHHLWAKEFNVAPANWVLEEAAGYFSLSLLLSHSPFSVSLTQSSPTT